MIEEEEEIKKCASCHKSEDQAALIEISYQIIFQEILTVDLVSQFW
jgi:hypothetical protein